MHDALDNIHTDRLFLRRPTAADVLASCLARLVLDGAVGEEAIGAWRGSDAAASAVEACCLEALHAPTPTPLQQTRAILRASVRRSNEPGVMPQRPRKLIRWPRSCISESRTSGI